MALTALYGWTIERFAYRPLRGSFRLAPLISAIGMSIFLQNFVQVAQGARVTSRCRRSIDGRLIADVERRLRRSTLSNMQIIIWIVTAVLLVGVLVASWRRPALGRAQRACEQDPKMASLLGVNVDRTISLTFVIGAALAAVAGTHVPDVLRRGQLLRSASSPASRPSPPRCWAASARCRARCSAAC